MILDRIMKRNFKSRSCRRCLNDYVPTAPIQIYCKECGKEVKKEYLREWEKTHKDHRRELGRQRYLVHRDQEIGESRGYRLNHKEEIKKRNAKRYNANREKCNAWSREWKLNHPEEVKEDRKEYYKNHREQELTNIKQWKANNRVKVSQLQREYFHRHRCNFGFIELNKPFDGADAHHVDKMHVIYMPREIHQGIHHSVVHNMNMDIINNLALNYLTS